MKNILVLAVVAVVLFSISAGLSVWLNQNRGTTLPTEKEKAPPIISKEPDKEKDKTPGKGPPKTDGSVLPDPGLRLNDAEDRLRRRESQMDLVLRDLAGERQAVDELVRQVTIETKKAADTVVEAAKAPPPPKAGTPDSEAGTDKKNTDQLSRLYAAMAPESAAPILKKMADSGQLDTSVRILAGMQERQAAQVLAAISQSDDALAAQITQRIRMLRRPAPAGAGGNVAPAAGGTGPLGRTPP